MIEYLPKNAHYGVRVFLDDNKNTIAYYIDIIDKIGIETGKGLYYDDLYLDVTIDKLNEDYTMVWDEDELKKALEDGDINKEQYDEAYDALRDILNQIAQSSNVYINNNHKEYIEKNFR